MIEVPSGQPPDGASVFRRLAAATGRPPQFGHDLGA